MRAPPARRRLRRLLRIIAAPRSLILLSLNSSPFKPSTPNLPKNPSQNTLPKQPRRFDAEDAAAPLLYTSEASGSFFLNALPPLVVRNLQDWPIAMENHQSGLSMKARGGARVLLGRAVFCAVKAL